MTDFSAMDQSLLAKHLLANIGKLPSKDYEFAQSLAVKASLTHFPVSEKQMYWLRELCARTEGKTERKTVDLGSLEAINSLFDKASQSKKFPVVVLDADGEAIRLSIAGPKSSAPGTINVTTNESYDDRTWFGRIDMAGRFVASSKVETPDAVVQTLKRFAADPVSVAAEYGHKTGNCCFCARDLTDERSIHVGYGPVCAERFGLSWGVRKAA